MRDVEEPGVLANRAVLGEDAGVLDGHREARELDHAAAEGAVALVEGRAAQGVLRAGGSAQAAAALEPESEPPEPVPPPDPESLFAALSEPDFVSGFESPSFLELFFPLEE